MPGVSGWERISATGSALAQGTTQTVTASCSSGKTILGGGLTTDTPLGNFQIQTDESVTDGSGWHVTWRHNDLLATHAVTVSALCGTVLP